jgi:hypothetical protein
MNIWNRHFIINLFLIGLITTSQISFALADDKTIWEPHPDIASTALTLKDSTIQIVIKNTSGSPKELFRLWQDEFVLVDYIDGSGKLVPLAFHPDPQGRDDGRGEGALTTPLPMDGKTFSITLTSDELSKLSAHPVVCRFIVFDRSSRNKFHVASKAIMLPGSAVYPSNLNDFPVTNQPTWSNNCTTYINY